MTILAVAIAEKRDRAVTAFRVAELIGIERGVARKRVERMADRGLVTRSPTGLRLTRKGWALVRKIGAESKQEKDKKQ
jgi:Mn-dependent DtxR family transcriptional regulator